MTTTNLCFFKALILLKGVLLNGCNVILYTINLHCGRNGYGCCFLINRCNICNCTLCQIRLCYLIGSFSIIGHILCSNLWYTKGRNFLCLCCLTECTSICFLALILRGWLFCNNALIPGMLCYFIVSIIAVIYFINGILTS